MNIFKYYYQNKKKNLRIFLHIKNSFEIDTRKSKKSVKLLTLEHCVCLMSGRGEKLK